MAAREPRSFTDLESKQDDQYISSTNKGFSDTSSEEASLDARLQHDSETFAKGGQTRYYKPCERYEGLHRWDPNAEWTEKEEKRIVRRVSSTAADLQAIIDAF